MKKIILLTLLILLGTGNQVLSWDLYNVSIVSRQERGADESITFKDHPEYAKMNEKKALEQSKHDELKRINWLLRKQKEDKQQKEAEKKKTILEYLKANFAYKFKISRIESEKNGKEYNRHRKFNDQKSQIIIHHTVSDTAPLKTVDDVKAHIRHIYRFHTLKRERGDIGYNFIIGPYGNIYEGRAGGEGVIGAHAIYNNNSSIGVALVGDFNYHKPTSAQLQSLEKLLVGVAYKYDIDIYEKTSYHKETNNHPYVETHYHDKLAGHKDAGRTSCPGTYLYNILPDIKQRAAKKLEELKIEQRIFPPEIKKVSSTLTRVDYKKNIPIINNKIILPYADRATNSKQCLVAKGTKILGRCFVDNKEVIYRSSKQLTKSTYHIITIEKDSTYKIATIQAGDLNSPSRIIQNKPTPEIGRQEIKKEYMQQHTLSAPKTPYQKIKNYINTNKIKELQKKDVKVLLYEASLNLKKYQISCYECFIQSDSFVGTANELLIAKNNDDFLVTINGKTTNSKQVIIKDTNNKAVFIKNYDRTSYAGIPRNSFYGSLQFKRIIIPIKNSNNTMYELGVINTLPLIHYLAGIVESNDTQSLEHNKTLAVLARNYVMFYLDENHRHPNIAKAANYNAIDDPDFFQKYVGAGLTKTLKKRYQALHQTHNEYLLYNNSLAFTPYFSCSPGFTWSAKEKRGWTDTPYLISQEDNSRCSTFKGHGVGMSGRGAAKLAKEGKNYSAILQYYFPGTTLKKIQ